jgi:IclR family acetate operon transcriptional repressor
MRLRTVDAALSVLELLAERGGITVRDVVEKHERSRSSAYRLVRTLHERGWLTSSGNDTYVVGPLALMLGLRATRSHPLREVAAPWLHRLAAEFEETATLSLLVADYRVCIDQVESPRQIRMSVALAQPFPLYAGASGRSILSVMPSDQLHSYLADHELKPLTEATIVERDQLLMQLSDDRERGYAVAIRERDTEAFSVAAPICDDGVVIGAIALCGPATRFAPDEAPRYGKAVIDAAHEIGSGL